VGAARHHAAAWLGRLDRGGNAAAARQPELGSAASRTGARQPADLGLCCARSVVGRTGRACPDVHVGRARRPACSPACGPAGRGRSARTTGGGSGAILGSASRTATRARGTEGARARLGCAARAARTADRGASSASSAGSGCSRAVCRGSGSVVGTAHRGTAARGPGRAGTRLGPAERRRFGSAGRRGMGCTGRACRARIAAAVVGCPRRGRARVSARAVVGGACGRSLGRVARGRRQAGAVMGRAQHACGATRIGLGRRRGTSFSRARCSSVVGARRRCGSGSPAGVGSVSSSRRRGGPTGPAGAAPGSASLAG
jgi:hypothetical protein